ncbi:AzlD domain-containing protein [Massilia sp. W12]|uniref:AzlD domain-containing protein n=1 Tax=Massilia sp. W12 TaxID=3126507 RepID=UPI0030D536B4
MSDGYVYLTIALLTVATLLTRSGFWLFGRDVEFSPRVRAALRFAPACALVAIVVPDLLLDGQQQIYLSFQNHQLLAAIPAAVFFHYKRNMLGAILLGMLLFTVLRLYA